MPISMASSLSFSSSIFLPYNSPTNKHNNNDNNNKSLSLPCPWRSSSSSIRSELKSATLPVLSFTGESLLMMLTLSLNSAPPSTVRFVVHRALVHDQQNARRDTASTLTRAEVRGGGKKPYVQKTGRARRGSQHTPLHPGGGVIFDPNPRDWSIKINRKERRLSISNAIASAIVDEDALVVVEDGFTEEFGKMGRPKTTEFVEAMRRWGLDPKDKVMFLVMEEVPDNVRLRCRNIGTVKMLTPRTLNLFDILNVEKLVFTKMAADYLNAMYGENADFDKEDDDDDEEIEKEEDEEAEGNESS